MGVILLSCFTVVQPKEWRQSCAPPPTAATPTAKLPRRGTEKVRHQDRGRCGILDTEKNYLIIVTKEGSWSPSIRFKFQPVGDAHAAKMADVALARCGRAITKKGDRTLQQASILPVRANKRSEWD